MTAKIDNTESDIPIADPPLVLVSDGIKSIYVNWQGLPVVTTLAAAAAVRL